MVNRKILVVDDDDMIRDVVTRLLKLKGYEPQGSSSGDEALKELANSDDYGYMILDLNMPGTISGEEVFYRVRHDYPEIKIIISTGFIDQNTAKKFREKGVFGILEKPYKIDDIIQLVDN